MCFLLSAPFFLRFLSSVLAQWAAVSKREGDAVIVPAAVLRFFYNRRFEHLLRRNTSLLELLQPLLVLSFFLSILACRLGFGKRTLLISGLNELCGRDKFDKGLAVCDI